MVIEEGGLKILTDPGDYSTTQNDITGVDVVLITHEHSDHLHIESLKKVLVNNPKAQIFTNSGVGETLKREGLSFELLEQGQQVIKGVAIEAFGKLHALIYSSLQPIPNIGYLIANRFFYPGDAFTIPVSQVEILALPVSAPWLKISESLDYAKKVNPKVCFPVHDGMLKIYGGAHKLPSMELPKSGINFVIPELGKSMEF